MIQVLKIGNKRILFRPSMKGGMLKGEEEEEQIVTSGSQPFRFQVKEIYNEEEEEPPTEPEESIEKLEEELRTLPEDTDEHKILKLEIKMKRTKAIIGTFEAMLKNAEKVKEILKSKDKFKEMSEEEARRKHEKAFNNLFELYQTALNKGFLNRDYKLSGTFSKTNLLRLLMTLSMTLFNDIQVDGFETKMLAQKLNLKNEQRQLNKLYDEIAEKREREKEKEIQKSKPKKKPTISEASQRHYEELIKAPEKEEAIISHLPEKSRPEITESEEDRQFREFNEHRIRINEKKNKTKNKDYEPNYNNLKIELQSIATSKSIGLGFAFEEACTGSGIVSGLLKSITSDSSEIVLTSVQNSLLDIQADVPGIELNQLECFVYDLIQLKNIIECKNFNTNDYLLDINTRRVIYEGVIKTFTIRGREPTQTLPGIPITRTKFEGNDGFLPIFIEKNGKVTLYDILQQNPKTGAEIGYTLTHHDQQVIFFWYTKNGLISFNLTEDIMRNPESYTREHFGTTGTPLNTFTIKPNLPIDEVGHKGRGLNYYIPFDRLRYHNKLV